MRIILFLTSLCFIQNIFASREYCPLPETKRSQDAQKRILHSLKLSFNAKKMALGSPVFIRIFKENKELELWVQTNEKFELYRTYPICAMSGLLGPKTKQGDKQAPEGFYTLSANSLNPASQYHLALNVGYPNHFDKAMSSTGSHIMIHGDCCSIGCFAMTNPQIEEIYTIIHHALQKGQKEIPTHIFPFHLTPEKLKQYETSSWYFFWSMLQPGYQAFEKTKKLPKVQIKNRLYHFADLQ